MKKFTVRLQDIEEFIYKSLAKKYKNSLNGLTTGFHMFLKIMKFIMEELSSLLVMLKDDKSGQTIVEDCMSLVSVYFRLNIRLEYKFVENFLKEVNEFLGQFVLYFHQVLHLDPVSTAVENKIKSSFHVIEESLQKLTDTNDIIEKNFNKQEHLLRYITETMGGFKTTIEILVRDISFLQNSTNTDQYLKAFNDCFKFVHKENRDSNKGELVRRMILLVKESCMNQIEMESFISLPRKLSLMIKNKEKAGYQIEQFEMNPHIVYNYCKELLKPDFIKSCLLEINLEEFVQVLKELLKQKGLIDELQRQNPIFFEKPDLDLEEFISTYFKWKNNLIDISELEKDRKYVQELEGFKEHLSSNMYELGKFREKLWEYQKSLVRYHMAIHHFNLLRVNIQKFCIKNFNTLVKIDMSTTESY